MIETLTRDKLVEMDMPVPVMLENGMMALGTVFTDTDLLMDVYRENDSMGQISVPFGRIVLLGGRLVAGLKGISIPGEVAEKTPELVMEHGDFDEFERHMIEIGERGAAVMRYRKRAGRAIG